METDAWGASESGRPRFPYMKTEREKLGKSLSFILGTWAWNGLKECKARDKSAFEKKQRTGGHCCFPPPPASTYRHEISQGALDFSDKDPRFVCSLFLQRCVKRCRTSNPHTFKSPSCLVAENSVIRISTRRKSSVGARLRRTAWKNEALASVLQKVLSYVKLSSYCVWGNLKSGSKWEWNDFNQVLKS